MTEHGSAAAVEMLPVPGLPEFRPGDDLAAAIAAAAPWLRDNDILVVTSKVVSKCEGRIVDAPMDPEERDALRRKLIDAEAVRVLARKGKTLITENALGLVQAAAGVDGSNVDAAELALLPTDPDASAAALRTGLRDRLGVTVGVVVTDTMGRAWRNGQTDVAIGAAGLTVLHGYEGSQDRHGNELIVTEIAVADEIAAAADLVKGKLTDIPVAVVRGLSLPDNGSNARNLLRPGEEDLFWLGTEEAIALGFQKGTSQAQLLRRSVRTFSGEPVAPELVEGAVAEALTAPAPHHTRPVRFVWMQDPARRLALLDRMKTKWRTDLTGDGRACRRRRAPRRRAARSSTTHPNSSSRSWCPTARTATPTPGAPPQSTRCSPSRSEPRCRRCWWRWQCVVWAAAGSGPPSSPPIWCATNSGCPPIGSRWAPSRSATPTEPSGPRDPVPTDDLLVRR